VTDEPTPRAAGPSPAETPRTPEPGPVELVDEAGSGAAHDEPVGVRLAHDPQAGDAQDEDAQDDGPQDQAVPDEDVPDEDVPDEAVPDEAVPEEAVPDEAVPDEDVADATAAPQARDLEPAAAAAGQSAPAGGPDDSASADEPRAPEPAEEVGEPVGLQPDEVGIDEGARPPARVFDGAREASPADADEAPTTTIAETETAAGIGPDAAIADAQSPAGTAAVADTVDASSPGGWTALGRALRPRLTKAQVLAGALCAVLGFALVVQLQQNGDTSLEGMRQADLVRMLDETTDRGDALARQESNLAAERDELLSGSDRRQAALDALERSATTQGILTGRLPAQGPGVIVTLTEPSGAIKPLTMLDVLEELRNAGAEAVQLNGHRVTASSAFTGAAGAVVLDGVTLEAPYTWIAIGDPDTIATALQIPGGAMAAVRNDGGAGSIARQPLVKVSAVRVVPDPVYATPVPAPTS
jgi:uncharacterized protein YlxW (UPF0749 family)